jgi:hypothetical protein
MRQPILIRAAGNRLALVAGKRLTGDQESGIESRSWQLAMRHAIRDNVDRQFFGITDGFISGLPVGYDTRQFQGLRIQRPSSSLSSSIERCIPTRISRLAQDEDAFCPLAGVGRFRQVGVGFRSFRAQKHFRPFYDHGTVATENRLSKCSGRPLGLCGRRLPELNLIPIQVIDPGKATVGFIPFVWGQSLLPLVLSGRAKHPDRPRYS